MAFSHRTTPTLLLVALALALCASTPQGAPAVDTLKITASNAAPDVRALKHMMAAMSERNLARASTRDTVPAAAAAKSVGTKAAKAAAFSASDALKLKLAVSRSVQRLQQKDEKKRREEALHAMFMIIKKQKLQ